MALEEGLSEDLQVSWLFSQGHKSAAVAAYSYCHDLRPTQPKGPRTRMAVPPIQITRLIYLFTYFCVIGGARSHSCPSHEG